MSDVDEEVWDFWEKCDFKMRKNFSNEDFKWKYLVVFCEHVEKNLIVNEMEYWLGCYCSRETTHHAADEDDNETEDLRMTTKIDDELKRPVVKLAPLFYESVHQQ